MRNQRLYINILGFLFVLFIGCKEWNDQEIYQRPHWLPGKLYTTVSVQENLSMFAECLRLTKLDSILDVSGVWSVFAPTNEAMEEYLLENQYASISDMPIDELERIAEFHIIQNPWTVEQLQLLGSFGWREGDDNNVNSYAYKRQTMLKNPDEKYWFKKGDKKDVIVLDSMISDGYRRVFVNSRKYVPIFYDDYFEMNGLNSEDYGFYFDRAYEKGNVYYAGAKILQSDIFAENGFVHTIDRVVEPMQNAKELLDEERGGESYKRFLELVYWYYPSFEPNIFATYNQQSVRLGGLLDTLWDINYTPLAFAPHEERTGLEGSNVNETLVRHNGLFAPTDDGFGEFIDGILTVKSGFPHWPDHKSLPRDIVEIVIGQHFKSSALYPSTSQYKNIFNQGRRFHQNEGDIIRREFGSNCTFIGLNDYIPDRVFTSVTGPVFLRHHYTTFRLAMQYAGVLDNIANNNSELYFFPIPDYALEEDSSMILNWIDKDENIYNFRAYDRYMRQMVTLNRNTIRNLILNQVGTFSSGGSTGNERIRTLRGNYINWNHTDNTIRGSRPSTFGYNGDVVVTNTPVPLEEPADNGNTWSVNYWFKF